MIEEKILNGIVTSEEYMRKVVPYIEPSYLTEKKYKNVFSLITKYIKEYNKNPSKEILETELDSSSMSEKEYEETKQVIQNLDANFTVNVNWLIDKTEEFCKERALYNALFDSVSIVENNQKTKLEKSAIPKLLQDALSVSFDKNVGHDYLEDMENRYEFYNTTEFKLPFDVEKLNSITNGGISRKTMTVLLAGTGCGKSLFMCHMAANYLMQNFNVLYITLEMAEERIAERIDSNLLDLPITEIKNVDKNSYLSKVKNLSSKTKGRLIVKEYPTASAHVGHFRYLLNELKEKKDFVPDVIVIDYLSICASERYKANANNMYLLNKAIAEELRGLAIEYNVPLITAGQVNRNGYNSSDLSLNDIAESFGIAMSSDLILGIITTEELDKEGKILMKQLKNRYNDPGKDKMFAVGIDRSRMKIYNVNDFEASIDEDVNVFDMSDFSSKMNNRKPSFKFEFGE